jgi:hypothetical protein
MNCTCNNCENNLANFNEIHKKKENNSKEVSTCTCKNSFCVKNYCVCYQNGKGCNERCQCFGCKNPFPKFPRMLRKKRKCSIQTLAINIISGEFFYSKTEDNNII